MIFFSPNDWIIFIIIAIVSLFVQFKMQSTYQKYSRVPTKLGAPANMVAEKLLDIYSKDEITIKAVPGQLTDHYNPQDQSLALSQGVFNSSSVAAIAIAAHELGHAMQDQDNYSPLRFRSALVPILNVANQLYWILFFIGFLFNYRVLLNAGIMVFALSFLFSLVTLPVELNASRRALTMLSDSQVLTQEELPQAKSVLTAAALTYVAAALTALLQLIRLLAYRNRRED